MLIPWSATLVIAGSSGALLQKIPDIGSQSADILESVIHRFVDILVKGASIFSP